MTERTTVNIDKRTHTAGNHIRTDYGEGWRGVMDFYVKYRPIITDLENGDVSNGGLDEDEIMHKLDQIQGAQSDTVSEALQIADLDLHELHQEVRKAQELAEQARDEAQQVREGMGR